MMKTKYGINPSPTSVDQLLFPKPGLQLPPPPPPEPSLPQPPTPPAAPSKLIQPPAKLTYIDQIVELDGKIAKAKTKEEWKKLSKQLIETVKKANKAGVLNNEDKKYIKSVTLEAQGLGKTKFTVGKGKYTTSKDYLEGMAKSALDFAKEPWNTSYLDEFNTMHSELDKMIKKQGAPLSPKRNNDLKKIEGKLDMLKKKREDEYVWAFKQMENIETYADLINKDPKGNKDLVSIINKTFGNLKTRIKNSHLEKDRINNRWEEGGIEKKYIEAKEKIKKLNSEKLWDTS